MSWTKRLLLAFGLLVLTSIGASAQGVLICYQIPGLNCQAVSSGNPLPVSASVSASISGFTATSTGTPISVTTGGVTGTLPAGAVVVATNVGATNGAYCALGASATTSSQYLSPGGGWFAFTVGASTQLTCITSTSTTTVNMTGGTDDHRPTVFHCAMKSASSAASRHRKSSHSALSATRPITGRGNSRSIASS